MDVIIRGKKIRLNSSSMIGSGGEAEVYDISGGEVAKIFKPPTHTDFAGDTGAQHGAVTRIEEHQTKLRAWPKGLPSEIIGPTSLVTDTSGKKIVGYTMRFLFGMEVLLKYGERKYRETYSVDGNQVVDIFRHLHGSVVGIHGAGAVIGDFNDLNVLVDSAMKSYIVDADSMQFGGFLSRVFTARFVDPLHCDAKAHMASLIRQHSTDSDWYAFHVMLMQSLLFVGPYGGVHIPVDVTKKLKEWERVQKRVTVFHSDVRYPKPALHYSVLPDTVLEQFHGVFEKDRRDQFPLRLFGDIKWTSCPQCKKVHARSSCPDCQPATPIMVKEVVTGNVEAMKILDTSGRIVYATVQGGIPRYVYHESGAYRRDGGHKLMDGKADPDIRFRIQGDSTVLAKQGQAVILERDGSQKRLVTDLFRGKVTVIDANQDAIFAVQGDSLKRFKVSDMDYADTLGTVLQSQTLVWTGDSLGFVFSRAGGITQSYVFHTNGGNLGQEVDIGRITGQVLDATAVFSKDHIWFMMAVEEKGQRLNRAFMFDRFGKPTGQTEAHEGDGSWLGNIRGKCATGKLLFAPTDDGIVRVEIVNGTLDATKVFADTNRFVDGSTKLLFGKDGMYAVGPERMWRLKMK